MDDVKSWFTQGPVGSAETSAAAFWRLFDQIVPDAQIVVVRRPIGDIVESLMRVPGVSFDRAVLTTEMAKLDRKLDQIEARCSSVLSVSFDDLTTEATCRAVFEHCLPYAWDLAHWEFWAPVNVQCDFRAMVRYVGAYRAQLEKLAKIAKHAMLTELARRQVVEPQGITLAVESFDNWLRDAGSLFDTHLVQVGEAPGDWQNKNIGLMRSLDNAGAMQIVTARSNGRMFGYLMTIIGPSMTSPNVTVGSHATFYADPAFPGLGLKLQRKALAELRQRGVDEVFMQDGVRGSGGRINAIYRRLGAVNDGQAYRLQLSGV